MEDWVERIEVFPVEPEVVIGHPSRRKQKLLHKIGHVELCASAQARSL